MSTRIMVIDDEPLICRLLEYQLGGAGYEVTSYQIHNEALLQLARSQPDLILLDVMMPEISGWDLCRQIRASYSVPIIMLTAKDGDDDVIRGLTGGADDYVGKPFNQGQLVARIEAVLRRAHSTTPRARSAAPPQSAPGPNSATIDPSAEELLRANLAVLPATITRPVDGTDGAGDIERLGPRFAAARRQRGLSLHDAGQAAGVRWEFLQAIEQEEFSYVPRTDLRTALHAYSQLLGVDLQPYRRLRRRRWRRRNQIPVAFITLSIIVLGVILISLVL